MLLAMFFNVQAKQLSFSKQEDGPNYHFSYQWQDYRHQKQSITFNLPKKALFDHFRNFKAYKPLPAQKYIYREVNKQLKAKPLEAVQVQFIQKKGLYNLRITGRNPEKIHQAKLAIKKLEAKAEKKYFTDNFYHLFTNHEQIEGIKPDHVRIGNNSVADFKGIKPLILEKVSIKNIRKATNYILGFVQNIPYSPLESRVTSSGAGFNPPLKLLWENQGDCDSKATLTAAMLRALMPRIEMVLVYIDQHAFIGIAVKPQADEITIMENNITYVLAEPTGPAVLGLGTLAPDSEQAILRGHYTTEVF
jgi:hypothetical protein